MDMSPLVGPSNPSRANILRSQGSVAFSVHVILRGTPDAWQNKEAVCTRGAALALPVCPVVSCLPAPPHATPDGACPRSQSCTLFVSGGFRDDQ